jgi:uncharacterized protein (DUF2147 family)
MRSLKKFALIILALLLGSQFAHSQTYTPDQILGTWLNEDKDANVEIYKENNKFFGKIIWLKDPNETDTGLPKVDDKNPDLAMQTRPVLGLVILKNFVFDGEEEWEDGTIYDPKNGKTYDCYMKFEAENLLKIRGYIGISWIGRTTLWTRTK